MIPICPSAGFVQVDEPTNGAWVIASASTTAMSEGNPYRFLDATYSDTGGTYSTTTIIISRGDTGSSMEFYVVSDEGKAVYEVTPEHLACVGEVYRIKNLAFNRSRRHVRFVRHMFRSRATDT